MLVDPSEALVALGTPGDVVTVLQDQRNTTWEVRTPSGARFVLKRYRSDRSMSEVAFELTLTAALAQRGWPVPDPIADPIVHDGAVWSACRYLPGTPLERSPENHRRLGRVIAELHEDLVGLDIVEQRDGWRRTDEFFSSSRSPRPQESFEQWRDRMPAEMRLLTEFADRAERQLTELRSWKQPTVLIHGDVTPWNVHYVGDRLTGLFDFEMAHRDMLVAEFSHSWRGRYDEFVEGFEEVTPLDGAARALIAPVRWAWLVGYAQEWLEAWTPDLRPPDLTWTMQQLERRSPLMQF